VYTIYDHPADYPEHWVIRAWRILAHSADPEPRPEGVVLVTTLEAARAAIPPGLARLPRQVNDDSKIVESWL
jgi:hypothetical protein